MSSADDPAHGDEGDAGTDAEAAREREERAAILRRRAVFVASAIAGLSLPAGCADGRPHPCLDNDVARPPAASGTETASAEADAGVGAPVEDAGVPRPCLSEAPHPPGSQPQPSAKVKPAPRPCLEMPPPQVCLEMPMPPPPAPPRACLNR